MSVQKRGVQFSKERENSYGDPFLWPLPFDFLFAKLPMPMAIVTIITITIIIGIGIGIGSLQKSIV